jgi:hypothetical protein
METPLDDCDFTILYSCDDVIYTHLKKPDEIFFDINKILKSYGISYFNYV